MSRSLKWTFACACILSTLAVVTQAEAKVSAEEAKKLTDGTLTPMGAEMKGNEEGTIPPWEGGITEIPEGFKAGSGNYVDPFADDKILFTITAANVSDYADKLSPGQMAIFRRYPNTFKMNVYPTRRSASYPQRIYDWSVKNATTAELVEGGNGFKNARESIPFPIPTEGVQAVWNHLTRYRNDTVYRVYAVIAPTPGGSYTVVTTEEKIFFPYSVAGATSETINNVLIYFLSNTLAPPRMAGGLLLVHETMDQVKDPRRAWTYNPGQRRVRRAPNVAYDLPDSASDGQRTADMLDMYNGAPDRYDWTLVGKKEMFVPYNSYKVGDRRYKYKDIIRPGHANPDLLRYELHRVWHVEAKVRKGTKHIYARRTFFQDEDTWTILVADLYDNRDEIWRVSEDHTVNYYEIPMVGPVVEFHIDLQNGRYLALGLTNEGTPWSFNETYPLELFTPAELRRAGRR
jgi:hypothetical protein